MRAWPLATVLLLALAGCGEPAHKPASVPEGPVVEGWVVDERIRPVVGASARLAGLGVAVTTDGEGHYLLAGERGVDLVVILEADGFHPQSRAVAAGSGSRTVLNFSLERLPVADPFHVVEHFEGILRCGVVVTLQEDPSRPHEHQGLRCSQLLNDTANRWIYQVPTNTTGIVIEADWDAQSELAHAFVLRIVEPSTGEVLAFLEDVAVLRVQLSSVKLTQLANLGLSEVWITVEPGAGTGNHEHGAAGAFLQQSFDVYATSFFNGPVPSGYSIGAAPA